MKRMDRYKEIDEKDKVTRSNKNQELYQNIGSNSRYTNFTDVTNTNAFDISNVDKENKTRENYQKYKEYSDLIPGPKVKRELEEFKSIYKGKENRVYDINSVIAEARKNNSDAEIESRRKLKNDKYNILLSMSKEELEEYRKSRKEKYTHPDEDELHELIDTIASKTLAGEIDKITSVNLLSELMATSIIDKVDTNNSEESDLSNTNEEDLKITTPVKMNYNDEDVESKEVEEDSDTLEVDNPIVVEDEDQDKSFISNEKINIEELNKIKEELDENDNVDKDGKDEDFYTKSIGISADDIESDMDNEFREDKLPIPVKILIFSIVAVVISVGAYFIYQYLK